MRVERLGPLIEPGPGFGDNINGPSLVKIGGRYHLYFAHHLGDHIRLATADEITGPYSIVDGGVLHLHDSRFPHEPGPEMPDGWTASYPWHIASPDVHLVEGGVRMYFHGLHRSDNVQLTRAATSADGLSFEVREPLLCPSYLRTFRWDGAWYGIVLNGAFFRSPDGLEPFEPGPVLWPTMRHCAVLVRDRRLHVVFSRWGDAPERLLLSTVGLEGDWTGWRATDPVEVMRPERAWEGARLPARPSKPGPALEPLNELRDPAFYVEDEVVYLLYAFAGERGIALARVEL